MNPHSTEIQLKITYLDLIFPSGQLVSEMFEHCSGQTNLRKCNSFPVFRDSVNLPVWFTYPELKPPQVNPVVAAVSK